MPICTLSLLTLAILMISLPYVPVSRAGMGVVMFAMGFLVFIPDSLLSGAAAIDFGTKRGAATANGLINGFGSLGQMIGVSLPGTLTSILRAGHDIWTPIFVGLGTALAIAGLMLAPLWNRLPKESV
jgi:OPA family sugar phosphate sensor protein UhpC-like MFS transporter